MRTFSIQVTGEEGDTQLNLKWVNLDEKRNKEDYCEGCKTKELRKRVVGLVEKLVGKRVVEKSQREVLFRRKENGVWKYFKDGTEKTDAKYVGKIINDLPNGQGTMTHHYG